MKVNKITKTVEEVIRTEYIAEDGTIFYSMEECEKYEESALFLVSSKLKKLNYNFASIYDLTDEGSEDCEIEIFDIQSAEDLDNLKRYLYLKATKNGATDKGIKECFTATNEPRKKYVFENVTSGHEVIIFWNFDSNWFYVFNDGSLNGYFEYIKERYLGLITPKKEEKNEN